MKLLDCALSIGILSSELMQNSHGTNFKDISKYLRWSLTEQQGAIFCAAKHRRHAGRQYSKFTHGWHDLFSSPGECHGAISAD